MAPSHGELFLLQRSPCGGQGGMSGVRLVLVARQPDGARGHQDRVDVGVGPGDLAELPADLDEFGEQVRRVARAHDHQNRHGGLACCPDGLGKTVGADHRANPRVVASSPRPQRIRGGARGAFPDADAEGRPVDPCRCDTQMHWPPVDFVEQGVELGQRRQCRGQLGEPDVEELEERHPVGPRHGDVGGLAGCAVPADHRRDRSGGGRAVPAHRGNRDRHGRRGRSVVEGGDAPQRCVDHGGVHHVSGVGWARIDRCDDDLGAHPGLDHSAERRSVVQPPRAHPGVELVVIHGVALDVRDDMPRGLHRRVDDASGAVHEAQVAVVE